MIDNKLNITDDKPKRKYTKKLKDDKPKDSNFPIGKPVNL